MSGNNRGRRNWTRSLTIIMIVAVIAVIIGCVVDPKTNTTDRLFLKSSAGPVLFDHGKHSQAAESCAQCHHDLYAAAQATACNECHDDERRASTFSHKELKELHSRDCSKCHQQSAGAVQPTSCRTCHPTLQQSEKNTASCSQCHDDSYSPDMMKHDEYLEIEDHTCLGCHAPKSVSDAYHTNCSNCHLETARQRFAQADGKVQCGACHLR